ncbi:TPA: hypothetical protein ACIYYZ_004900, partial [Escherichia coli]
HGSEVPQLTEPSKNHLPRWFFRFQSKRLRVEKKDLKQILFDSCHNPTYPPHTELMKKTVNSGISTLKKPQMTF